MGTAPEVAMEDLVPGANDLANLPKRNLAHPVIENYQDMYVFM